MYAIKNQNMKDIAKKLRKSHFNWQTLSACFEAADRIDEVIKLVDEQAEDEGLWFVAETTSEAYLQSALRRLHAVIEGSNDN